MTSKVLLLRDVSFNEHLLYGNVVEQSHTSSSNNLPNATVSFTSLPHPTDDPPHSSSSPSEPILTHDSVITFSSHSIPDTGRIEHSSADVVSLSPLTPRTLLSHPNYQTDTPVRMRPLAEIENLAPSSPSYDPPSPLTQAHLIHTFSDSSIIINSPLLELAAPSSQSSNPITVDFSPDNPFTYLEALHSPNAAQWVHAMTEEINSLKESKT